MKESTRNDRYDSNNKVSALSDLLVANMGLTLPLPVGDQTGNPNQKASLRKSLKRATMEKAVGADLPNPRKRQKEEERVNHPEHVPWLETRARRTYRKFAWVLSMGTVQNSHVLAVAGMEN